MVLAGCAKKSASTDPEQTATVQLTDGGSFSGVVTKSDTSAITLKAANGETRTYPTSQVNSVLYTSGSAPEGSPPPTNAQPPAVTLRNLPAATTVTVRNNDTIQAGVAQAGQRFPAVIVRDVIGVDGGIAIPKGSNAMLAVRESRGQGKVKGQSEIVIDLASVEVNGAHYDLETTDVARKGKQGMGKNRRSLKFMGGGAVLGTVIGAVAGGGAGAAIGAASGGAAGAGLQAVTRGKAVRIPAETLLSFRLEDPVSIRMGEEPDNSTTQNRNR
jgi:hypothetical protein